MNAQLTDVYFDDTNIVEPDVLFLREEHSGKLDNDRFVRGRSTTYSAPRYSWGSWGKGGAPASKWGALAVIPTDIVDSGALIRRETGAR